MSYERGVHYVAFEELQLYVWTLTNLADGQIGWMLAHKPYLSPYNHQIQWFMKPTVPWEAVKYNEAIVSLFESCNIKGIVYDEEHG